MLVTAPNGLETGFDPNVSFSLAGVNRIPHSTYSPNGGEGASAAEDDGPVDRKIEIGTLSAGRYFVQATGGIAGHFILRFRGTDENGTTASREFSGSTWPGHTVVYIVQYSPNHGKKFNVIQLTPFADISAGENVSSISPPTVHVAANFTLGPGSKGADPATQPVFFRLYSYVLVPGYAATVPAGSFVRNAEGDYSFDGTTGDLTLKVEILPEGAGKFSFDLEAQGAGLRFTHRPVQLLIVLGNNGGVARFTVPPSCVSGKAGVHPVTTVGKLLRQFKCEPTFWKQLEIGKKIVALHDRSVLAELAPMLSPQKGLFRPSANDLLVRENVAFVFAGLRDDLGFRIIREMLEDRSNSGEIRYYAALLLGDLKGPKPLIQMLNDKSPAMRVLGIYGLEQIDRKQARQALPKLRKLLNDNAESHDDALPRVSTAARQAIIMLERKP